MRESGDHGPINSWDRVPYITTVATGKPSVIPKWRHIHHNLFFAVYNSQEAVDNDDGSSHYNTTDNVQIYGTAGLKSDFGGDFNHHLRNTYVLIGSDCGHGGPDDELSNNDCILRSSRSGLGSAPVCVGNTVYSKGGDAQGAQQSAAAPCKIEPFSTHHCTFNMTNLTSAAIRTAHKCSAACCAATKFTCTTAQVLSPRTLSLFYIENTSVHRKGV